MNLLIVFGFLLLLAACLADALTTLTVIAHGGREQLSAWAIGPYPSPAKVMLWVFLLPVLVAALALMLVPSIYPVCYPLALWRAYMAWRNRRILRALA